jgi:hypothetical protein
MNGGQACTGDVWHLAQVKDEVPGRVFIDFPSLIHNLHEIRGVDIPLKPHNGNGLTRLLHCNSDIHGIPPTLSNGS